MAIKSIVIGTDGTDTAAAALERAAALAKAIGAQLHVVTAYRPRQARMAAGQAANPDLVAWQLARDSRAQAILDEACAAARIRGVEAEAHARSGDPADAILQVAEEEGADLVVVGNKGMTGRRHMLGNVPNRVSHHASCSVLIVNTTSAGR